MSKLFRILTLRARWRRVTGFLVQLCPSVCKSPHPFLYLITNFDKFSHPWKRSSVFSCCICRNQKITNKSIHPILRGNQDIEFWERFRTLRSIPRFPLCDSCVFIPRWMFLLCKSAIDASVFGWCMTACTRLPINCFRLFSSSCLNFGTQNTLSSDVYLKFYRHLVCNKFHCTTSTLIMIFVSNFSGTLEDNFWWQTQR